MTDPKRKTRIEDIEDEIVEPTHIMEYDPEYDDAFDDDDLSDLVDIGWSWDETFDSDYA